MPRTEIVFDFNVVAIVLHNFGLKRQFSSLM